MSYDNLTTPSETSANFGLKNERKVMTKEEAELIKEKEKIASDMSRILEAAKPPDSSKTYLELETAKAVMEKVTDNKRLPSTTNINRAERWELIKLRVAYHYSANPVLLIVANSHMELNRSLTFDPINVLAGLFRLPFQSDNESINAPGRWGRFKQMLQGR